LISYPFCGKIIYSKIDFSIVLKYVIVMDRFSRKIEIGNSYHGLFGYVGFLCFGGTS
jgi:hypothetical protein